MHVQRPEENAVCPALSFAPSSPEIRSLPKHGICCFLVRLAASKLQSTSCLCPVTPHPHPDMWPLLAGEPSCLREHLTQSHHFMDEDSEDQSLNQSGRAAMVSGCGPGFWFSSDPFAHLEVCCIAPSELKCSLLVGGGIKRLTLTKPKSLRKLRR